MLSYRPLNAFASNAKVSWSVLKVLLNLLGSNDSCLTYFTAWGAWRGLFGHPLLIRSLSRGQFNSNPPLWPVAHLKSVFSSAESIFRGANLTFRSDYAALLIEPMRWRPPSKFWRSFKPPDFAYSAVSPTVAAFMIALISLNILSEWINLSIWYLAPFC